MKDVKQESLFALSEKKCASNGAHIRDLEHVCLSAPLLAKLLFWLADSLMALVELYGEMLFMISVLCFTPSQRTTMLNLVKKRCSERNKTSCYWTGLLDQSGRGGDQI